MMQAKCINDQSEEYPNFKGELSSYKLAGLTKDKLYQVKQSKEYEDYFEVINDLGVKENYKKERFEVMEEKAIKVRCINNNSPTLTFNKEYDLIKEYRGSYSIKDDLEEIFNYPKNIFEKVDKQKENNHCYNKKCAAYDEGYCLNKNIECDCRMIKFPFFYEEQCKKLTKLLASSEDHNKIFSKEVERLKKENKALENTRDALVEANNELKEQNELKDNTWIKLEKEFCDSKRENNDLKERLNKQGNTIANYTKTVEELERENEEINKELYQLRDELQQSNFKLKEYETKLPQIKSLVIKLVDINKALAGQIYVEELED